MDLVEGGSSDGGLIIIVSVVLLGLVCTSLLTLHMINQNKARRIIEANERDRKMMELSGHEMNEYTNVKGKGNFSTKQKVADHMQDSVEQSLSNFRSPMDGPGVVVQEYGDQYNANHDFAIFQGNNERLGGVMNLAQKQNQADCIADKSMSMASEYTERAQTEEKTEKGEDANQLPEDQEWAEI
jgi:hypothetical protein